MNRHLSIICISYYFVVMLDLGIVFFICCIKICTKTDDIIIPLSRPRPQLQWCSRGPEASQGFAVWPRNPVMWIMDSERWFILSALFILTALSFKLGMVLLLLMYFMLFVVVLIVYCTDRIYLCTLYRVMYVRWPVI